MWHRGFAVGGFYARAPISIALLAMIVVSGTMTIVGARTKTTGGVAAAEVAYGSSASPSLRDCFGQPEPLAIFLLIRDTARVPDDVLTAAQADVTHIYREAGVEVLWPTAGSLSAVSNGVRQAALTVAVVTLDQAERMEKGAADGRVGFAARTADGEGQLVYVIYDRVQRLTGGNGLRRARMLAIAMAHEIGHLLLPSTGHSTTGLMRAYWTLADLRFVQRELLFFTLAQGKVLRSRVSSSPHRISGDALQKHLCSEGSR